MSGPEHLPVHRSGDGRATTLLMFIGGLVATIAVVAAVVVLWPEGDDESVATGTTSQGQVTGSPGGTQGEPSERTTTSTGRAAPAQLFEAGADDALADMADAAGDPDQAIQVAVYPSYAFLAYQDPAEPSHVDRRSWRDGADQDDAAPNPITDRVDASTKAKLFPLAAVDLAVLPKLVKDAEGRFGTDVTATHVLIDRFLPFDQRVLIRVYASPSDGRSGGGYVQYTLAGTYVKTVQ